MAGELAHTTKPSAARPSGTITGYERMHLVSGDPGVPRPRHWQWARGFIGLPFEGLIHFC
jgi:hypothetical protein